MIPQQQWLLSSNFPFFSELANFYDFRVYLAVREVKKQTAFCRLSAYTRRDLRRLCLFFCMLLIDPIVNIRQIILAILEATDS